MASRPVNESQRENYKSNYDTYGFGGDGLLTNPGSSPYDQERKLATQTVFGSARHSQRGAEAQLEQQGLGGIPGLQSAVAGQARAQNLSSLEGMNRDIGNRELQTQRLQNAHSEALRREKEAKDEASKARWAAIANKLAGSLVAAGVTLATGGTGTAAAMTAMSPLLGAPMPGSGQPPMQATPALSTQVPMQGAQNKFNFGGMAQAPQVWQGWAQPYSEYGKYWQDQ